MVVLNWIMWTRSGLDSNTKFVAGQNGRKLKQRETRRT